MGEFNQVAARESTERRSAMDTILSAPAALRAAEMQCDVLAKGTQVDGVYSADPHKHADAKFLEKVGYLEALERGLRVMDTTAISLCMDNKLPIVVFNATERGNFRRVVQGEEIGSVVTGSGDDE